MRKLLAVIAAELVFCVVLLVYIDLYVRNTEIMVANYGQYVFHGYYGRGVFTVRDICVEENSEQAGQKLLVIYNSHRTSRDQEFLSADHSKNSRYPGWPVVYRQGPIPDQHSIADHPAYFVDMTCEGNLYHLIEDALIGLYGLMEATGRVGKSKRNQVFSTACTPKKENECHSHARYRDLVEHLGVVPRMYGCLREFPDVNVCYSHAGFGFLPTDKRNFYRYLKSQYGLGDGSCNSSGILLVERKYRRVLNMAELEEATVALGLPNTHVERVDFADLTMEQQIQKIQVHCSHIIVGVQGAGLQWIYFLPDHSAVLEIGWKKWPRMYVDRGKPLGIKGTFLESDNITINWTEYKKYNKLETLSEEKKVERLHIKGTYTNRNPYKYADTYVGVDAYLGHLQRLLSELRGDGVLF